MMLMVLIVPYVMCLRQRGEDLLARQVLGGFESHPVQAPHEYLQTLLI
ncbi:MAG: hypothetical protein V3T88_02245 [Nitrosomonadaceae bacterium]